MNSKDRHRREGADVEREENEAEAARLRAGLEKLQIDYYSGAGGFSEERFHTLAAELTESLDIAVARVAVACESIWTPSGAFEMIEEFDFTCVTFTMRYWWSQASLDERRSLLRSRIKRIEVRPDREAITELRGDMSDHAMASITLHRIASSTLLALRNRGERGQSTAEYALLLLGAATIALIVVSWATGTGKI